MDKIVVRRGPTLAALTELGEQRVSFAELARAAGEVCAWCGMSDYKAVCGDCCLLRFLGELIDSPTCHTTRATTPPRAQSTT